VALPSYTVNIMDTLAAAAGFGTNTLEVFNTGNGSAPGSPFIVPLTLGDAPFAVAVTPDGRKAYVTANGNDAIRIVDTITANISSIALALCTGPRGIAMALVGTTPKAFVACTNRRIAVIDASNDTVLSESTYGQANAGFYGVAVTPDDAFVYVTDAVNDKFVVLDSSTALEIGTQPANGFSAGVTTPHGIAINGDIGGGGGTNVYIAGSGSNDVIAISTADNTTIVSTGGASISTGAGSAPEQVSVTPDHSRVYVTLNGSDEVAVFDDSATPSLNTIVALAGGATSNPFGVTIPPLLTVPLTGLRVFIANSGNDEIEIRDDSSPFGANATPTIALTGTSAPHGVAHIPVPR
jgi:DNA-binding beta-propeller fold protein YncE